MCLEWCGSNMSTTYRGRASYESSGMNLPLHNFLFPFIHHGREVIFCGIPIRLPFAWLSSCRWRPVIISLYWCIPVWFKVLSTFIHWFGSRVTISWSIIRWTGGFMWASDNHPWYMYVIDRTQVNESGRSLKWFVYLNQEKKSCYSEGDCKLDLW